MTVLVTGSAGFIGMHVALALLERGERVVGLDNLNPYYDVRLKHARLARLAQFPGHTQIEADLSDRAAISALFEQVRPRRVVHLAAQAGVRYAQENPHVYVSSNVTGFLHVLEGCRAVGVEHLVYASTSSVYGANRQLPFAESQSTDHPLTLYAATKKANESMAHSYANLYGIATSGLRFFTVYGPWGRPDMAFFKFTRAIENGEPLPVYNQGRHTRDFTWIDDVVVALLAVLDQPSRADPAWNALQPQAASSAAPWRVLNVGGSQPVPLLDAIAVLEHTLGRTAVLDLLPLQAGDVPDTAADPSLLDALIGARPRTPVSVGIPRFVNWYRTYHGA